MALTLADLCCSVGGEHQAVSLKRSSKAASLPAVAARLNNNHFVLFYFSVYQV